MTARPEDHRHVLRLEASQAVADIVDLGDHEIEMIELSLGAFGDADAVMIRVWKGAKERDEFANGVGLGKVQDIAEEGDRLPVMWRRPHDVAQALDLGDAG